MQAIAPTCIACGSAMQSYFERMFDDRYGFTGYYDIYRCPLCKQGQTVPLLRDEDLPELYGSYYPRREIDIDALQRAVGETGSVSEKRRRWISGTDNQGQYAARPGMVVLDYGCGAGQSLLELEKLGAEAYGLEADPNARQVVNALGLRIHIGTIDENPFPGVMFDLIVMNQVLEHIPRPDELLAKLVKRLRSGGRIVLSIPNSDSIYCKRFGRDWINWHIPYHLHHFNPRSIRLFLRSSGWNVLTLRTITPNLWTVLQLRALVERTGMGIPHPMWTGKPTEHAVGTEEATQRPSRLTRVLYSFAQRVNQHMPRLVLTAFNRACDALGRGDSIHVTIVPKSRPS
jgi:SAM-dependent methyltransferase